MKKAGKLYRCLYPIVCWIMCRLFTIRIVGAENIPSGPVMVCANHTSWLDALFIPIAFGKNDHLHIVAKKELFRIPVLSGIFRKLEIVGVDRAVSDVSAIRAILGFLKCGEKIAIFPEGTRVLADDAVAAKRGAVWLADRAGVPLLPVYLPARKRLFRKNTIVVGEPYVIPKAAGKCTAEEYLKHADGLMEKIRALGKSDENYTEKQKNARRVHRAVQDNGEL